MGIFITPCGFRQPDSITMSLFGVPPLGRLWSGRAYRSKAELQTIKSAFKILLVCLSEETFKRRERKGFRKGRRGKPLRSSAKSPASFAFRSERSSSLKMVTTQFGILNCSSSSLTRIGKHTYFSGLQRRNDFDFSLLAINNDAAIGVRGKALDCSYQTFNGRGREALQASGLTALA